MSTLRFVEVEKSFFRVKVLQAVSFDVPAGETVGLVGENGAGKSTLMNILGGNLTADRGQMVWDGQPYAPASPKEAARAGIAFIHQELNLFPNLTIAENLFLDDFPRRWRWLPWIDRAGLRRRARELLAQVQLELAPETPVDRLAAGERQLVEIAKALGAAARLIIFDEPTTSLTEVETGRLFRIMQQLRQRGLSMIYISHNLAHVRQLADCIVVLRDGQVIEAAPTTALPIDRLVRAMVGRDLTQFYPSRHSPPRSEIVLQAKHLHQPGVVRDISFTLHAGQVVGLAGLMGSGRSELARILFGLDPCARGELLLRGRSLQRLAPAERIGQGLAFLTEDRGADGLCASASIADNLALASLRSWCRTAARVVDQPALREAIGRIRASVRLTASAPDDQAVRTLSGGNQQKVVLGKWLLARPAVLILDEPTRGIDLGAKQEIYTLINELVLDGAGVLFISSELEELIGMCDRILVLSRGALRDELARDEFDRERILKAAMQGASA